MKGQPNSDGHRIENTSAIAGCDSRRAAGMQYREAGEAERDEQRDRHVEPDKARRPRKYRRGGGAGERHGQPDGSASAAIGRARPPVRAEPRQQPLRQGAVDHRRHHPGGGDDAGDHHRQRLGHLLAVRQRPAAMRSSACATISRSSTATRRPAEQRRPPPRCRPAPARSAKRSAGPADTSGAAVGRCRASSAWRTRSATGPALSAAKSRRQKIARRQQNRAPVAPATAAAPAPSHSPATNSGSCVR